MHISISTRWCVTAEGRTSSPATLNNISNGLAHAKRPELEHQTTRARRTHGETFARVTGRTDYRPNSFFPSTVTGGTALPHQEIVDSQSLDTFIMKNVKPSRTPTSLPFPLFFFFFSSFSCRVTLYFFFVFLSQLPYLSVMVSLLTSEWILKEEEEEEEKLVCWCFESSQQNRKKK